MVRGALLSLVSTGALLASCLAACDADLELDEPPWPVVGPPAVSRAADLVVDADRDGVADPGASDDQRHGAEWNARWGASFLANLDDDDGDGVRDVETPLVDGDGDPSGDARDLARIVLPAWPEVPLGALGTLTVSASAAPHVRVQRLEPRPDSSEGSELLLGVEGPCPRSEAESCDVTQTREVPNELLRSGALLGIEALHLPGELGAGTWDGLAELSLVVHTTDGLPIAAADGPADGIDRVLLRVAPWVMASSSDELDRVYASTISEPFLAGLGAVLTDVAIELRAIPWTGEGAFADHWTQDWFQPGSTTIPTAGGEVHGMRVALARPFGYGGTPLEWLEEHHLGRDTTAIALYAEAGTGSSYDSFGNHELIPAYQSGTAEFPLGRLLVGRAAELLPETLAFYEGQRVQQPVLDIDTGWLDVGHVDEVIAFVPAATARGWKMLLASPSAAEALLEAWQQGGYGAAELFAGKSMRDGQPAARSIDSLRGDPDLAAWNQQAQVELDLLRDALAAELELAADEIVEVPVVFEGDDGLIAYLPNAINALVLGDVFVAAAPFGPLIDGQDGLEADLRARLGGDAHALGADGRGLTLYFVDDWTWYHLLGGEVHCATNAEGPPAAGPWWEARP